MLRLVLSGSVRKGTICINFFGMLAVSSDIFVNSETMTNFVMSLCFTLSYSGQKWSGSLDAPKTVAGENEKG